MISRNPSLNILSSIPGLGMPEARTSRNFPGRSKTVPLPLMAAFLLLGLCCFLPKSAAASSGAVSEAATELVFFDLSVKAGHSELLIIFDGEKVRHEFYSLDNPRRLVLDIFNVRVPEKIVGVPVNRPELTRLRISQDHQNVRFILDLPPTGAIKHQIEKHPRGIKLSIFREEKGLSAED